jgi:predicted ester cyclase
VARSLQAYGLHLEPQRFARVLMGVPPTGKTASFAYMDIYAISNGQIVETWHVEDLAGMS